MNHLQEISLKDIKKIELNILLIIDDLCRKHNIKYFLCYGTLLGAVRHGGFIPWDDDIDIVMQRNDYNKFLEIFGNCVIQKHYSLISSNNSKRYYKLYSKFVDLDTIIVDSIDKTPSNMGVFVDIFPVDYLGNSMKESISMINKSKNLIALLSAKQWKRFVWNKERPFLINIIRLCFFFCSFAIPKKMIKNKIKKSYSLDKHEFCGVVLGECSLKEIMPSYIFDESILLPFEGHYFYGPKMFDEYLKILYDDYLKLPPEHDRVSNHCFIAYYRGKQR